MPFQYSCNRIAGIPWVHIALETEVPKYVLALQICIWVAPPVSLNFGFLGLTSSLGGHFRLTQEVLECDDVSLWCIRLHSCGRKPQEKPLELESSS